MYAVDWVVLLIALSSPALVPVAPVSEKKAEHTVNQFAKSNPTYGISLEKAYAELLRTHASVLRLKNQVDEQFFRWFYVQAKAHKVAENAVNHAEFERDRAEGELEQAKDQLSIADDYYQSNNETAQDLLNNLSFDSDIYEVNNDTKIADLNREHYAAAKNRAITNGAAWNAKRRADLIPYREILDAKKDIFEAKDRAVKVAEANEKSAYKDFLREDGVMENARKALEEAKAIRERAKLVYESVKKAQDVKIISPHKSS
ncbi:hypothetical protein Ddc_19010 [Ditylenchus destructor]|nr:hypothetical protein Ddc_19010 [Ditylenchus destructor]